MAGNELTTVPQASSLALQEENFTAEGAPLPPLPAAPTPEDCMVALDQLETKLAAEIERRRLLELEVRTARNALDTARRELIGTQAGERYARHLALHDELTSLPNRSGFLQRLTYQLKHLDAQRPAAALLFLDLDAFKPINDEHGHAVGDEVLRVVGARLYRAVRSDDMMSRLGGDEFACLPAAYLNWEQLSHLAAKLIGVVSAPMRIRTLRLEVHASVGIAIGPTDGTTAETLLRSADAAMYRAKREHTGYAFVAESGAWTGISRPATLSTPQRALARR